MAKLLHGCSYVPSCAHPRAAACKSLHRLCMDCQSGAAGWGAFLRLSADITAVHLTSVSAFGGWSFALG
eukprot:805890-Prymnesium_polylepis.1